LDADRAESRHFLAHADRRTDDPARVPKGKGRISHSERGARPASERMPKKLQQTRPVQGGSRKPSSRIDCGKRFSSSSGTECAQKLFFVPEDAEDGMLAPCHHAEVSRAIGLRDRSVSHEEV